MCNGVKTFRLDTIAWLYVQEIQQECHVYLSAGSSSLCVVVLALIEANHTLAHFVCASQTVHRVSKGQISAFPYLLSL